MCCVPGDDRCRAMLKQHRAAACLCVLARVLCRLQGGLKQVREPPAWTAQLLNSFKRPRAYTWQLQGAACGCKQVAKLLQRVDAGQRTQAGTHAAEAG